MLIYFIAIDAGRIKIGITKQLKERLRSHRRAFAPHNIKLLGLILSQDNFNEKHAHRMFRHLRLGRVELYQTDRCIMEFIDQHCYDTEEEARLGYYELPSIRL